MAQRTRRRISPPMRGLLAVLAVAFAVGVVGAPTWVLAVGLVVLFAGVVAVAFRRSLLAVTVVPDGPVPCARCDDAPRTATGWCEPCTSLLREHPVPAGHPIHTFAAASTARDLDAMAACVADPTTTQPPSGRRIRLSRKGFRRNARIGLLFFRDGASRVAAMYREPAEPDSVWMHTHDTGKGFLGSGAVDTQLVIRYRFEQGLIAESVYSPPLPRAYSGLAA